MYFFDILLTLIHVSFIGFCVFGWMFKSTRKANLIFLGATFVSWFLFGVWKGIGYCVITDYHYQIKTSLGETNLPYSYIKYLWDGVLPSIAPQAADILTITVFFTCVFASIFLNIRDKKLDLQKIRPIMN
jgi:hypothetical protein|tara:strand:+ start:544 stop:933 length:390 start_codon:yes stop_codon:yes gene_type:complete